MHNVHQRISILQVQFTFHLNISVTEVEHFRAYFAFLHTVIELHLLL